MKYISLYIDIAFCVVVLPVMMLIFPIERWYHNFQWYVYLVGAWLYLLYIANRMVTVPALFSGGQRRRLGMLALLVSVAVTYAISSITLYTPKINIHDLGIVRIFPMIQQYQQAVWSLFMIVEAFSFAVGMLTQANGERMRRFEAEAERDKAEIELYKAQIKPHFMFNTLNSLYGLFLTQNPNALESLEKYISMMRYIHTSSQCDLVPLTDEADYIRRYVGLQSLRLNEMTSVSMTIDIEHDDLPVPPMLLVTFVENCFKHGASPVEESRIEISLVEKEGVLRFETVNRIFPVKRIGEHMGIDNCRKRLELLYPGRHEMSIKSDGTFFNVKLSVRLI